VGYYDLYKARTNMSGETYKDREINQLKRFINDKFLKSPSYHLAYISGVEEPRGFHIYDENAINKNPNKKRILSRPNETFNVGQYVVWEDNDWLITNIDCDSTVQTKGIMQKCNNQISLYINDVLHKIPCCVDSAQMRLLNTDSNKYLEVPSTDVFIRIANNELTQNIKRNDIYKIGEQNYRVSDISDILEPGLLILKIAWVAEKQDLAKYKIKILNGDISISQSQQLFLNVEIYKDDEILTSPPPYSFISSNENIAIVGENNELQILDLGVVDITVMLDDDNTVSDTIQIEIIEDEQNNIVLKIIGESSIVKGYSEQYVVEKYNNGIKVDGKFNFYIIDNTPQEAYELTIIDENKCSIKAKNNNYNIILRVVDKDNENLFIDKEISLITLF